MHQPIHQNLIALQVSNFNMQVRVNCLCIDYTITGFNAPDLGGSVYTLYHRAVSSVT
ncbi:hypothetical protein thalar_00258 [Litoreibacter arenae DSM 19593]|uniref:Uncharacterized protein n=1 Tax=Litoreibacter arenae DSM 19593 TaxID=1123360 RepID=S9QPX4_9RHOB|nr:hypothetical protein thalar_00258 [Litoreibacter arenae DSM 19593]